MNPEEILSQPTWDDILSVLRSDKLRSYRVDIETDSTVEPDATEEKQQTIEFMQAVTQFLRGSGEIIMNAPETTGMFMAMLKSGVRKFKAGREVEDKIDEAAEALEARAKKMLNAPPQPDPKVIEAEQKAKLAQAELQMKQQGQQVELQMRQAEMQQDAVIRSQEAQTDAAAKEREAQTSAQVEMQKAQLGSETELAKAELGAETDIAKARIQAAANRDIQRQKPNSGR